MTFYVFAQKFTKNQRSASSILKIFTSKQRQYMGGHFNTHIRMCKMTFVALLTKKPYSEQLTCLI